MIAFDSDLFVPLGTTDGLNNLTCDKDNMPVSGGLMREVLFSKLLSRLPITYGVTSDGTTTHG